MTRRALTLRPIVIACAAALLALGLPAPARAHDVLPDLDQMVPRSLVVKSRMQGDRRVFHLGFSSAAANVGAGDLTLHGYRLNRRTPTMRVDQLVDQSQGTPRLIRDVGRMSYVVHPDHKHWHLLGFEQYEIRLPNNRHVSLRKDRKTGFCLGDRFAIPEAPRLPGFSGTPLQGDTCGLAQPDLLSLFAGISIGWGDRYEAHIEGQYIDVTGLPTGRYVLVHRVNVDGKLAESDYTNNASSVLFSLAWKRDPRALPHVEVLQRCFDTPVCPG